jgi:hypothetical protein
MSITDTTLEHRDESLTMRTSTLATMMAEWTALGMMLQRKSRRCKSKRRSSWTSIFLDKPGLNPAMARYASRATLPYEYLC